MTQVKPSLGQDILWRLEAFAYDVVTGLARLFPIDAVSDFGAWLFKRLGPLTDTHRVAEINLRIAFPNASDAEIARLLTAQWDAIGRWAVEFPILDKIIADPKRVELVNGERLAEIHATYAAVLQTMSAALRDPFKDEGWTDAFRDLLAQLTNTPSFARLSDDLKEMQGEVRAAAAHWYAKARTL